MSTPDTHPPSPDPRTEMAREDKPPSFPEWRCPECGCYICAFVAERKPDNSFAPGSRIRCVNCKRTFPNPWVDAPAPAEGAQSGARMLIPFRPNYRHVKTGGLYQTLDVVTNGTNGSANGQKMVLYTNGIRSFVRELAEFSDGRFVRLDRQSPPRASEG